MVQFTAILERALTQSNQRRNWYRYGIRFLISAVLFVVFGNCYYLIAYLTAPRDSTKMISHNLQSSSIETKGDIVILRSILIDRHNIYTFGVDDDSFQFVSSELRGFDRWKCKFHNFTFHKGSFAEIGDIKSHVRNPVILFAPHYPENMFHLHEDLVMKLWYVLMQLEMKNAMLWLFEGSRENVDDAVEFYPILHLMFEKVEIPFEDFDFPIYVDTLIWPKKTPDLFYSLKEYNLFENVIPKFREHIWDQINVIAPARCMKKKPILMWIARNGSDRLIANREEIIGALQEEFEVRVKEDYVRVAPFKGISEIDIERVKALVREMAEVDVLIGGHGAGLSHMLYMHRKSMVLQIRGETFRYKTLFMNMAHLSDLAYFEIDGRQTKTGVKIDDIPRLVKDISERYFKTCGWCAFPRHADSMTSMDESFCHMQRCPNGKWVQCVKPYSCTC